MFGVEGPVHFLCNFHCTHTSPTLNTLPIHPTKPKPKPNLFFDLETTGTNTPQDRILRTGTVKIKGGEREAKNVLLNPGFDYDHQLQAA